MGTKITVGEVCSCTDSSKVGLFVVLHFLPETRFLVSCFDQCIHISYIYIFINAYIYIHSQWSLKTKRSTQRDCSSTDKHANKSSLQCNVSNPAWVSMSSNCSFLQIFVSGIPGWHTLLFLPKAPLDPQEVHPHHQALTWFFIFCAHLPFMFRPLKSCPSQQTQASKAWTLVATCTAFMDFGLGMWRYDLWWCGQQLWTGA